MNDLKLQEGLQPIDKHLRPIKVGDEISALEISTPIPPPLEFLLAHSINILF